MTPRLRGGHAVGQRPPSPSYHPPTQRKKKYALPAPLELCECTECKEHPGPHPLTQLPSTGRWLPLATKEEHDTRDATRGLSLPTGTQVAAPSLNFPEPASLLNFSTSSFPTEVPTVLSTQLPLQNPVRPPVPLDGSHLLNQLRKAEDVVGKRPLSFKCASGLFPSYPDPSTVSTNEDIDQLCALDPNVQSNSEVIGYQETLADSVKFLQQSTASLDRVTRARNALWKKQVEHQIVSLRSILFEEYKRQYNVSMLPYVIHTANLFLRPLHNYEPVTLACYLAVVTLHLVCGLSLERCSYLLACLRLILELSFEASSSIHATNTVNSIYSDVRTIIDVLDVNPQSRAYVCCPKCFSLYWIDPQNPTSYPLNCTQQETDQEVCGAKLRKKRKRDTSHIEVPVREFLYRSMSDYLARLYARPDLHPYLDRDPTSRDQPADHSWDIWDAPCLRNFLGPDKKAPFIKGPKNEGRLIFSLNMDGLNPFGNKQAGKKVSVGGIYMVCLNLPPSLRYELENMYLVGVIPGPNEPSTHQINYLLRPLVDDLLVLWKTGLFLTQTHKHHRGWLVRCAVVPLVCDLPAARQMSGFAGYKSKNFCSECNQKLDDINNLDYKNWVPKNYEDHLKAAVGWLKAETNEERERWFNKYGVRWSELLRLPYWDPTQFTLIDSVHAFYLRNMSHHCRSIWGMDIKFDDGDGILFDISSDHPGEEEMKDAHKTLEYGTKTELRQLRVAALRELCRESSTLDTRGKKALLLERLLEYCARQGWPKNSPSGPKGDQDLASSGQSDLSRKHDELFLHASKSTIKAMKKADLLAFVQDKVHLERQLPDMECATKVILIDLIQKERQLAGIIDDEDNVLKSKSYKHRKTRVLGRQTLSEIRKDMKRTQFPSWMAAAPAHPGESKWGKFSADQWRTFCIQILPITLIRLWGSKPEGSRERDMLDNFMHLVSAVKLATMRKMTPSRIAQYEHHMHTYLKTLLKLYPDTTITPYQHLSLHFGSLLERFGPTHAWRCFPFERYNYIMQQIPTNQKFGELEKTLFNKFSASQTLRSFYNVERVPKALHSIVDLYGKVFKSDIRGTYLNDALSYDEWFKKAEEEVVTWGQEDMDSLSSATYDLLRKWIHAYHPTIPVVRAVYQRSSIDRLGQRFSILSQSVTDCHVVYRPEGEEWAAACIIEIFSHTRTLENGTPRTQTFLLLNRYIPLSRSDATLDRYRDYPIAGGRLFYNDFEEDPIVLPLDMIECHFASYVREDDDVGGTRLLALPLDKS